MGVPICRSDAVYMLSYCSRGTTAGTSIMGRSVINSSTRTVKVYRNNVQITSDFTYIAGETLTVFLKHLMLCFLQAAGDVQTPEL